MAGADLSFDLRDLLAAALDSYWRFSVTFWRNLGERSAISVELGLLPSQLLPALDDDIDVLGIKLHSVADPLVQLRGRECGAGAQERIVNEFSAPEMVQD